MSYPFCPNCMVPIDVNTSPSNYTKLLIYTDHKSESLVVYLLTLELYKSHTIYCPSLFMIVPEESLSIKAIRTHGINKIYDSFTVFYIRFLLKIAVFIIHIVLLFETKKNGYVVFIHNITKGTSRWDPQHGTHSQLTHQWKCPIAYW